MGKLFGTDGIRGEANRPPMDAQTAFSVGQAITHFLKKPNHQTRIIIGKDTRISGYMLESSLEAGITSMGGTAYLAGVLPTPGISFVTESMRADAGIVISASHNPYQDNGLKIFSGNGFKLSDSQEEFLEQLVFGNTLPSLVSKPKEMGRAYRISDVLGRYIVFLKNTFPRDLSLEGFKMVLDTANGATYKVAPEAFWELGAEVETIHNEPNGFNINDNCGSQFTSDLKHQVAKTGAAVGLAFDGDGDRLIAVDEKGREIDGDRILFICAKILKSANRLSNNMLVGTVMSNLGLKLACKAHDIQFVESNVGDRYVLEKMQEMGSVLGGEQSGHVIFLDHHNTGDGILTAIQLVAAMIRSGKPLSELAAMVELCPQKLINVQVSSRLEFSEVPQLVKTIQEVESKLGEQGRVLVRYSGTQNICRVMVEGSSLETTEKYCQLIAEQVKKHIG